MSILTDKILIQNSGALTNTPSYLASVLVLTLSPYSKYQVFKDMVCITFVLCLIATDLTIACIKYLVVGCVCVCFAWILVCEVFACSFYSFNSREY